MSKVVQSGIRHVDSSNGDINHQKLLTSRSQKVQQDQHISSRSYCLVTHCTATLGITSNDMMYIPYTQIK